MAVTQNSYIGNGSTTTYSFTFPYIKTADVKAQIDANVTTAFTLPTATTLKFNTAPANGAKIKIYRETDSDSLTATFYAGSAIKAEDLNENFNQNLYSTQEVVARYLSNLAGTMVGDLTMGEDAEIIFEGATDNDYETKLTVVDPTSDRVITLPNITGTVITTGDTGTVTSTMIADLTIVAGDLASNSVTTAKITDANITTAKIAADAIDGTKIADNAVNTEHIADNAIDTAQIANNQVTTAKIADDAITADKIAANAVGASEIAADAVGASELANNAVDTAAIANDAVTQDKIADNSVGNAQMADNAIGSSELADNAVTNAKMADDSVGTSEIANNAVSTAKIADNAVTADKIADAAIITASEQSSATVNDTSFLTSSASDGRYFRQTSSETILDGATWTSSDAYIASTAAIDDRIVDLVDDVGGFVPIANETSFPTANPDVNNGTGTLVSIQSIGSTRTPSGGSVTIANGA